MAFFGVFSVRLVLFLCFAVKICLLKSDCLKHSKLQVLQENILAFFGVKFIRKCSNILEQKKRLNKTNENQKNKYANKIITKKYILLHYALNPFFRKVAEKVF